MSLHTKRICLATLVLMLASSPGFAATARGTIDSGFNGWEETIDEVIPVKPGGTLTVEADRGGVEVDSEPREGVRIIVEKTADVFTEEEARRVLEDYKVDISRDGNDVTVVTESTSDRSSRSLDVSVRVIVPSRFNVDISTGGGGIEVGDLEGNVVAETSGGGIEVGRIRNGSVEVRTSGGGIQIKSIEGGNGEARTSGGGISVGDVTGNLEVRTSGGGIDIGDVAGDLIAETAGGGIRIGHGGTVFAQTGGGGIAVEGSAGQVRVKTSGGGITIDDANGPVEANTSGGGIRIRRATGPVEAHTSGGGISLEGIAGSIDASTSGGGITAELVLSDEKVSSNEVRLETGGGDIRLTLPAKIKADVDAEVRLQRSRRRYRITSDFDLDIQQSGSRITARGEINGGGDEVSLSTTNGDIEIRKR